MPDKIYVELFCLRCGAEFSCKGSYGLHRCICGCLNSIQACVDKKEREERKLKEQRTEQKKISMR